MGKTGHKRCSLALTSRQVLIQKINVNCCSNISRRKFVRAVEMHGTQPQPEYVIISDIFFKDFGKGTYFL